MKKNIRLLNIKMKLYLFLFLCFLCNILYCNCLTYSRVEPSNSSWLPAGLTQNINLLGNQTDWTLLPDCRGSILISYCLSNTALAGYTSILRATQFGFKGFPNMHPDYPVSGIEIKLLYTSTGTDVMYQFENFNIIDDVGNPNSYSVNGTFYPPPAGCCQTTFFGNSTNTWGLNLKASNINNTNFGLQFNVNRLSGSPSRFPRIIEISMRIYYELNIVVSRVTPNNIQELLIPTNFTVSGDGFVLLFGNSITCKIGNTNSLCVVQNSKTIIFLSPILPAGSYPIKISIDNGLNWTNNVQLTYTSRPNSCSLNYINGVSCDGLGNSIISTSLVIKGNGVHNLNNIILNEEISITAPNATLILNGTLVIFLKNRPNNKIQNKTLILFVARTLIGTFDNITAIKNVSDCEKLKTSGKKNVGQKSSFSVTVLIDFTGCQVPVGMIVGIILGTVAVAVIVGISINCYRKYEVKLLQDKATEIIKEKDHCNLQRELTRASEKTISNYNT